MVIANVTDSKKKKISIIIPALNEEEGIERTIKSIPVTELEQMNYEVEILVVDNGSTDRTGELARKAGAKVVYETKRGYGSAYKTGFANATGEILTTADADASYPNEEIPKFVQILEQDNLDFITTNRFANMDKEAMPVTNRFGNFVLNIACRVLFQVDIKDSQSGMWIFKKKILDSAVLKSDGMPLSEELKLEACYFIKCRWKELPIHYRARIGRVKLRAFRDGFENLFYLFKKRISR